MLSTRASQSMSTMPKLGTSMYAHSPSGLQHTTRLHVWNHLDDLTRCNAADARKGQLRKVSGICQVRAGSWPEVRVQEVMAASSHADVPEAGNVFAPVSASDLAGGAVGQAAGHELVQRVLQALRHVRLRVQLRRAALHLLHKRSLTPYILARTSCAN